MIPIHISVDMKKKKPSVYHTNKRNRTIPNAKETQNTTSNKKLDTYKSKPFVIVNSILEINMTAYFGATKISRFVVLLYSFIHHL